MNSNAISLLGAILQQRTLYGGCANMLHAQLKLDVMNRGMKNYLYRRDKDF